MMKIYLIIGMIAISISCRTGKRISDEQTDPATLLLHEGKWISNFKNEVFIRCLKKLYPQEFSNMLDRVDGSTSANVEQLNFDQPVLAVTDSLASAFTNKSETTWAIEKRKVTLNVCVAYRNSVELDEIAVKYYKKFVKPQQGQ